MSPVHFHVLFFFAFKFLDQWRSFDNLTRSSVPAMARLREFEDEHLHLPQTEAEEETEVVTT